MYKQWEFKPGQIAAALRTVLSTLGISEDACAITAIFDHGDGGKVSKPVAIVELEPVCSLQKHPMSVIVCYPNENRDQLPYTTTNYLNLSGEFGVLMLNLNVHDASHVKLVFGVLEQALSLTQREQPDEKKQEEISLKANLEAIKAQIEQSLQRSCFLSYRFNKRSKHLALELTRFFELMGIRVISGSSYEPRRIGDKVLERLKANHDLFVYLITNDGESGWTRDELAVAYASGVPVVLLIEAGAKIENGILGDWERIEFDGDHIGDTFIPILEALAFVQEQKRLIQNPKDEDS